MTHIHNVSCLIKSIVQSEQDLSYPRYICVIIFFHSLDKPGPPAGNINFNLVTADMIILSWEPVPETDQGGAKVTHYVVEKRETSRVVWSIVSDKLEYTHVTVGKLMRGNEYVFRVMGVSKLGVGEPLESEPVVAKNAFGKCITYCTVEIL